MPATGAATLGDADLAAVADVLADRSRCRILLALGDGRALAASVLADEAGVAASTASAHLRRLVDAGLLRLEAHGRHRYYRLAGPRVGELIEAVARVAPPMRVRSLREGSRAEAVRRARTCYDHLAGRLGVSLMDGLLRQGLLRVWEKTTSAQEKETAEAVRPQIVPVEPSSPLPHPPSPSPSAFSQTLAGGGGELDGTRARRDRLSAPGWDVAYVLTDEGVDRLDVVGVDCAAAGRRPLVRYCVDWSEQRHHLAGALGARLAARLMELGWVQRLPGSRAVRVTEAGAGGLRRCLDVDVGDLGCPLPIRATPS